VKHVNIACGQNVELSVLQHTATGVPYKGFQQVTRFVRPHLNRFVQNGTTLRVPFMTNIDVCVNTIAKVTSDVTNTSYIFN